MMKKFVQILAFVLISAMMLTGCSNFTPLKDNPDPAKDAITNNNSMAVQYGKYLYMVNGQGSQTDDNTFGKPIKGSIVRVLINETTGMPVANSKIEDVNDSARYTIETVVPKIFYTTYIDAGIFISKTTNRIYYVSPSMHKDKTNNILNTTVTDVFSCKLDGSDTKEHIFIASTSFTYKFYEKDKTVYLAYINENKVTVLNMSTNKTNDLVEKYTNTPILADDGFVYYTKAKAKEDEKAGNELFNEFFKLPITGGDPVEILDAKGEALTKKYIASGEYSKDNYASEKTLSITPTFVTPNGDIFFTRNDSNSTTDLYYYVMNKQGEVKLIAPQNAKLSKVIPISYAAGFVANYTNADSSTNKVALYAPSKETIWENISTKTPTTILSGTFTTYFIKNVKGTDYLYFTDSESFLRRIKMTDNNLSGNKDEKLTKIAVNASFLRPVIDTKNDILYFLPSSGSYANYVNLAVAEEKDGKTTWTAARISKLSEADQKTWDKEQEDKKDK